MLQYSLHRSKPNKPWESENVILHSIEEKGFHFCKRIGNLVRRQEENPAVRLQTKPEIRPVANQPIKRKDKRQLKPIE
ncbi:hypothetical protein CH330_07465 [candidate division WOR-3 bacterium JGI_Cruoil_03_51_56]|uniref:Uncharacterized protein n=1 Tax=candidate division WOR-3 bacterium JGI_Cruoil_03_51_56 TaxID=1973747 RepID=A0A235BQX0_UNCW3|nr:MAG: hypothetical protein CH330_07465 [candidate division WOR-3 bacterium JGI_Cruoil_03_51_56]